MGKVVSGQSEEAEFYLALTAIRAPRLEVAPVTTVINTGPLTSDRVLPLSAFLQPSTAQTAPRLAVLSDCLPLCWANRPQASRPGRDPANRLPKCLSLWRNAYNMESTAGTSLGVEWFQTHA